jgi:hypothetical protein
MGSSCKGVRVAGTSEDPKVGVGGSGDKQSKVGSCYRQKLTWSIWAKKRAAIKMGFEDNHD